MDERDTQGQNITIKDGVKLSQDSKVQYPSLVITKPNYMVKKY